MEAFILKQLFRLGRGDFSRALSKSKPQSLGTEERRKQQELFWSLNFLPQKIKAHQHTGQEQLTKKIEVPPAFFWHRGIAQAGSQGGGLCFAVLPWLC